MKKEQLIQIIKEEIAKELANESLLVNEIYDLDQVKYSQSVRKHVDSLNDIILALGLNRTQITMYMNMIKQQRQRYNF